MLKKLLVVLTALVFAQPAFASDQDDVKAAILLTMKYANAGDDAGFAGMLAPSGIVIDEFAPFHWNGFDAWGAAYGRYNQQNVVTANHTTILGFKHVNVSGDHAYAVARVVYSYKEHGVPRKEAGTEVFVLEKTSAGWRCASFAWLSMGGVDAGADATAAADAVRSEFEGFNTGKIDFAALKWIGVLDEFPPYQFRGPTTVADWGAGFGLTGQTDTIVTLGAPTHLSVNGSDAYIVLPATITGKLKGKPLKEQGAFAFTLTKTAGGWRTQSWAWAFD